MEQSLPSKTFCLRAWSELAVSPTGTLTPCCVFERPIFKDDGEVATIWNSQLQEVWNGKHWRDIRKKMLLGERVYGCEQCYQQEAIGGKSKRVETHEQWRKLIEKAIGPTSSEGKIPTLPQFLDLKLTNKCNLACRMCQPKDSNFVDRQFKKIRETEEDFIHFQNASPIDPFLKKDLDTIPQWTEGAFFSNTMEQLYPSLRQIAVAGGEPFLLEKFYHILEEIIAKGNAKETEVIISTNLTLLPKRFINLIDKFKQIHLCVSIDGFEKSLEYIRYPIKWQKFDRNVRNLLNVVNELDNVCFSFAATLQALNVLELPAILKYYDRIASEDKRQSRVFFYLHHVTYPEHLRLEVLPIEILDNALNNLESMKDQIVSHQRNNILAEIDRIIHFIREAQSHSSPELLKQFISYNKSLDRIRNHHMAAYLPELSELIHYDGEM